MLKLFSAILVALPVVSGVPQVGAAQGPLQKTDLQGIIVDQNGIAIPAARVMVYADTIPVADTTTDTQGAFSFSGVARQYRVTVRASGFAELNSSPVPFASGGSSKFTLSRALSSSDLQSPVGQTPISNLQRSGVLHEAPVREVSNRLPWELGALLQGGIGTGNRSDYSFMMVGGQAGKVLTSNFGTGLLQGNFEYAVEVFPFWQSYTPRFGKVSCAVDPPASPGTYVCSLPYTVGGTFSGVSVTPIVLRWNFTHGQHWMPFVQGAGGLIWTNHKYPAIGNTNRADTASNGPHGDTSVWNFTPQFGVGTRYFLRQGRSLDIAAKAVHISSASLGDKNPGVNASVQFSVGYTWWR